MSESAITIRKNRAAGREKPGFFTAAATLMVVIMFVGFSRTFYLRPLFDTTDLSARLGQDGLPIYLLLHGITLSFWFVLFSLQAWLVALRKVRYHRQIGYFGIATALAVIVSGALATIRFIPRRLADGGDYSRFSGLVVGNFLILLLFLTFIALAVYWRYRTDGHKRLMFLASYVILGPALGGGNRPLGAFLMEVVPDPLGIGIFSMANIIAVLVLAAYDFASDGRIHQVTISCGSIVAIMDFVIAAVARSETGIAFTRWVGGLA